MKGSHALGIDIGTSGVRVALLGSDQRPIGQASKSMSDFGDNRRSPASWFATLDAVLSDLAAQHDLSQVGAVSVDGTSGTVVALDASGAPVGDALMYNDAVDDPSIPEQIGKAAPRESAAHGPASALARTMVLQQRSGVERIVHQADWIAEQLAGAPVPTDESNALKTGYDPVARQWPDWFGSISLNTDLLPSVLPCGTRSGELSGAFGLPKGVPLVAGVTDGCASFLATGASEPGDGVTALGTTLTLKLLSEQPVFAPEYGIYSHRIGDMWLAGGASNTGGGVLAAHFEPQDLDGLSKRIDPDRPTGLDYYPLTKPGERFPTADPSLAPRLEPRPDDDAIFLQALFEGIARIERTGYDRLFELGAPALRSVRTVGGGAGNPVWRAIRENTLEIKQSPSLSEDAAVGSARLAHKWLQQ